MRRKHFQALGLHGLHRIAYTEWGDPTNSKVLVCVHGLTRNGRDFDVLARALENGWRIVCPDMPGRGDSAWLPVKADYALPTYMADCATLIARLDVETVAWLGTSMGGMIGMSLAALPDSPIAQLIVNDVGPFIPSASLKRIADYVGTDPRFPDLASAEAFLRLAIGSFGIKDPAHWRHMAEISTRPTDDGQLRLHYDPGIAEPFFGVEIQDISFWPVWEQIRCPTLLLRGADSDLLLRETAMEMTGRGPKAELIEFQGCGHAPALMSDEQVSVVRQWLERA